MKSMQMCSTMMMLGRYDDDDDADKRMPAHASTHARTHVLSHYTHVYIVQVLQFLVLSLPLSQKATNVTTRRFLSVRVYESFFLSVLFPRLFVICCFVCGAAQASAVLFKCDTHTHTHADNIVPTNDGALVYAIM